MGELEIDDESTLKDLIGKIYTDIRSSIDGGLDIISISMGDKKLLTLENQPETSVRYIYEIYGDSIAVLYSTLTINQEVKKSSYRYTMRIENFLTLINDINLSSLSNEDRLNFMDLLDSNKIHLNEPFNMIILNINGVRKMINKYGYMLCLKTNKICPITNLHYTDQRIELFLDVLSLNNDDMKNFQWVIVTLLEYVVNKYQI